MAWTLYGRHRRTAGPWFVAAAVDNRSGSVLSDARWHEYAAGHIAVVDGDERAMIAGGVYVDAPAVGSAVERLAVVAVVSAGIANRPSLGALPSSFASTRACQCVSVIYFVSDPHPSGPLQSLPVPNLGFDSRDASSDQSRIVVHRREGPCWPCLLGQSVNRPGAAIEK